MTIQWFPGHMARARREIEERLKLIDIVFELLDTRVPLSSRNPMIDQILQQKPRLILLNKADLGDPKTTEQWIRYFQSQKLTALAINSAAGQPRKIIQQQTKQLLQQKINTQLKKGVRPRAMRALIVGIPNVGKSTLINRLAGKQIAATGDRPGVTKGQQWIKAGGELELLDTPGILWPKFEDPMVGLRLAATGAIKSEILDPEEVAFYLLKYLIEHYPSVITERLSIDENLPQDLENPLEIVALLEAFGRRRGCLQSGGSVDLEKASGILLREFRSGKLGDITLEKPDVEVQKD